MQQMFAVEPFSSIENTDNTCCPVFLASEDFTASDEPQVNCEPECGAETGWYSTASQKAVIFQHRILYIILKNI